MITVRFSNETADPLDFMVEPWGAVEVIPPGSKFAIVYPSPADRPDTSHAEYHTGMIRFWCEGSTYDVDVDGERIVT